MSYGKKIVMTTFEYFAERYEVNHDYMVKCISKNVPVDSFRFMQIAARNCWGGARYDAMKKCGVDEADMRAMQEAGYIKIWDDYTFPHVYYVALYAKGLKAFYKWYTEGKK